MTQPSRSWNPIFPCTVIGPRLACDQAGRSPVLRLDTCWQGRGTLSLLEWEPWPHGLCEEEKQDRQVRVGYRVEKGDPQGTPPSSSTLQLWLPLVPLEPSWATRGLSGHCLQAGGTFCGNPSERNACSKLPLPGLHSAGQKWWHLRSLQLHVSLMETSTQRRPSEKSTEEGGECRLRWNPEIPRLCASNESLPTSRIVFELLLKSPD